MEDEFEFPDQPSEKLPGWVIPVTVAVLLCIAAGLFLLQSLKGPTGTASEPAASAPVHTPIPGPDGSPAVLDIYFVDVGNGCCTILKSADGRAIIVDAGNRDDVPAIRAVLDAAGIRSFDFAVVSCADKGHIGGMADLLSDYPASICYMTEECSESPLSRNLLALLQSRSVPAETVRASFVSVLPWAENTEVRIVSPFSANYEDENDLSIMLRVSYGSTAVLLAGDAHKVAERLAVKALPNSMLHSNVLLVSDHGSGRGTGAKFLSAVKPSIAVISCGKNSPPDTSTVRALQDYGATVIETETTGTVHVTLDGAAAAVIE